MDLHQSSKQGLLSGGKNSDRTKVADGYEYSQKPIMLTVLCVFVISFRWTGCRSAPSAKRGLNF